MAQSTPPVHILRRRHTTKDLYEAAAEGLKQTAPLTKAAMEEDIPLSPKWEQLFNAGVGQLLSRMENMKGLSDGNRYKGLRGKNYRDAIDAAEMEILEALMDMMEAFRSRRGTREVFDLNKAVRKLHEREGREQSS